MRGLNCSLALLIRSFNRYYLSANDQLAMTNRIDERNRPVNKRIFSRLVLILVSGSVLLAPTTGQSAEAQSAESAAVSQDATASPIATPLKWKSSGVLVRPISDESHTIVSVKDPTVVHYDGLWHIYATAFSTSARTWSMVYLNFKDWSDAPRRS